MRKEKIAILGAGGLGRVMLDFLEAQQFEVIAFFDDDPLFYQNKVCGKPVLELNSVCEIKERDLAFVLAILDPNAREQILLRLKGLDTPFINFFAPTAFMSPHASLGTGCSILDNTFIMNGARLTDYIHIHFQTAIGHDVMVGPYTTFGPNCVIGGYSNIGKGVKCGMGVKVMPNVTIEDYATIGAGALVTKNVPPNATWGGVPAKPLNVKQTNYV